MCILNNLYQCSTSLFMCAVFLWWYSSNLIYIFLTTVKHGLCCQRIHADIDDGSMCKTKKQKTKKRTHKKSNKYQYSWLLASYCEESLKNHGKLLLNDEYWLSVWCGNNFVTVLFMTIYWIGLKSVLNAEAENIFKLNYWTVELIPFVVLNFYLCIRKYLYISFKWDS